MIVILRYMMYHKALTFDDVDTAEEILRTSNPRKCKALGRATKGFDEKVWNKLRSQVVEQGSYLKYTRGVDADGEGLKHKLLATENREFLEASNYDRVWGVGYSADDCRKGKKGPAPREKWGQNLLGKALMATRKRIREEDEAEAKAAHEGAVKT